MQKLKKITLKDILREETTVSIAQKIGIPLSTFVCQYKYDGLSKKTIQALTKRYKNIDIIDLMNNYPEKKRVFNKSTKEWEYLDLVQKQHKR